MLILVREVAADHQIVEAALGELAVILVCQKGSRLGSGLIWKLPVLLQLDVILRLPVSAHGTLILEIGGIFRLDAHCVLLLFYLVRFLVTEGFSLILLLGPGLLLIGGLLLLLSV